MLTGESQIKIIFLLLFMFFVFGCGTPSVEDFKKDEALLKSTLKKCYKNKDMNKDDSCINAKKAVKEMIEEGIQINLDLIKGAF